LAHSARPIAVLGATGYTGSLVCEQLRELGLPVRLVGRRAEALAAAARPGEEVRVADATDAAALDDAVDGAFAVISTAGPFLAHGFAPVEAALGRGVHYMDSCTEQAYSRQVYERFGGRAAERGVVLLTAFANAPGDLAAGIATESVGGPLDEVVVANEQKGLSLSRGSRETLAHVLEQPVAAWEGGRLVPSRFGESTRRVRFPSGERTVIEWGGPEPLTVPRRVDVRSVRAYVRAPRAAALVGRIGPRLAPVVRVSAKVGPSGPSAESRRQATFAVVAEARREGRGRRVTLLGRDVYGTAALVLARAAEALRDGEVSGVGALSPSEAFAPRRFVAKLAPLIQLESVVDF
jgi:short subunit dehydrogenase-like uncharacterized protein